MPEQLPRGGERALDRRRGVLARDARERVEGAGAGRLIVEDAVHTRGIGKSRGRL